MAHIRLTVNGKLEMDADLDDWQYQPPELIRDMLVPGAKPKPALKAAMMAVSDAHLMGQPVDINLETDSISYTLTVKELSE